MTEWTEQHKQVIREALEYRKEQTEKFVAMMAAYGVASKEHLDRIAAIDTPLAALDAPPKPQPPAQPTMPSEVREVLTTAMDNLYVDLEFEAIVLAPRIAQNMDAALAWLDAHSPHP